ncbi:porin [Phenylobacterium sp.]|uniref:OprO/OprP family phosphate-selective porin n=1 Tax=Phenylobacterium sp. TaxID=1871053 RepID=UPI00301E0017
MNMTSRTALLAALLAGASTPALAQTTEERIAALEARIAALSGELAELKAETARATTQIAKTTQDAKANQAASPPEPASDTVAKVTLANGRPALSAPDGSRFAIRSTIQFDAAAYDERAGTNDLNSGTNFRRARIGLEGTFEKHWNYSLIAEFGGSGTESPILNQAFLEYAGWRPAGLKNPIRLRIGGWAPSAGLEDATSNAEALFIERPAVAEMVRNMAGGDARSGVGVLANGDRWFGSLVLTGGTVGASTPEFDEQGGYIARAAFTPLAGEDWALHAGASVQGVFKVADTGPGTTTVTELRFRERPELRVDGARLVDTAAIRAKGMTVYGGELGIFYRNLHMSAEVFRIDVDRIGGFNPRFGGWYVQGAWTLTGERHEWSGQTGSFRGVKPKAAFSPADGHWGALEIAARYSVLDLNAGEGAPGTATPVFGIRGGEQEIATVALNWYPNALFRFQLQYLRIDVDRLSPTGVQVGDEANVVALRSQVSF